MFFIAQNLESSGGLGPNAKYFTPTFLKSWKETDNISER